jgi:hypothetical protein
MFPLVRLVDEDKDGLIYLASPFTHKTERWVERQRYEDVLAAYTNLIEMGFVVHSPIVSTYRSHRMMDAKYLSFWMRLDTPILIASKQLWVLTLHGWEQSVGVAREIEIAEEHKIPVKLLEEF